jgi:hypothetical protein
LLECEGYELEGVSSEAALPNSGAEPKELGNSSSSSSRRHKDSAPDYHTPHKGDGIEDRQEYWENIDAAQAKHGSDDSNLDQLREAKGLRAEQSGAK